MRLIRKTDMKQGRWRNGLGVSWDIADWPEGSSAGTFGWRFALARIESDVAFSAYPETDRIFTLVEGDGLDLAFAGRPPLAVDRVHVPHVFPCDIETFCRIRGRPCIALNLFLHRGAWQAAAEILTDNAEISHDGPILLFILGGTAEVNGIRMEQGDAAIASSHARIHAGGAMVYVARLTHG